MATLVGGGEEVVPSVLNTDGSTTSGTLRGWPRAETSSAVSGVACDLASANLNIGSGEDLWTSGSNTRGRPNTMRRYDAIRCVEEAQVHVDVGTYLAQVT